MRKLHISKTKAMNNNILNRKKIAFSFNPKAKSSISKVFAILLLSTIVLTVQAEDNTNPALFEKQSSIKREAKIADFNLDREITVYTTSNTSDSKMMCNRVTELLKSSGCTNIKNSRKAGTYNIRIEKVGSIYGVDSTINDAYCMKIHKDEVIIEYLSAKSMAWAFQALRSNIVKSQSFFQKMTGGHSLKIEGSSLCETSGISGSFEIEDLTKYPMNTQTLENHINNAVMNNKFVIYLKLVSTDGVAVKSEMINSVNPFVEISQSGLSYSQLNHIYKTATDNGIELIPLLDFVSEENVYFENYTGHKIHSTEGLRFSKVLVSEFATHTSFEVVCLGGEPSDENIKEKYLDSLVDIFNQNGKDVVIHINQ